MSTAAEARRIVTDLVTNGTTPPPPRHPRLRWGRLDLVELADVVIALICWGATNSQLATDNAHHHHPYGSGLLILVGFVTSAPLALRTRLPLAAWAASALAMIWASLVIPPGKLSPGAYPPAGLLVYGLCLYAVAVRGRPRIVVAAALVTAAGAIVAREHSAGGVILAAIPLLIGVVVRVRRSGQRMLVEQERRHSGERALLEERQRIARELHDVVAHHMSVIAIQAEAAPYRVSDPPEELVESFGHIRASALSGLTELRRVLGVLRSDRAEIAPQPSLRNLEELLDSARSGGVTVTTTRGGPQLPLPDVVNLSAYRIVQEALSNAIRHAPGSHVQIRLSYGHRGLALQIRNDARSPAGPAPVAAGSQPVPDGANAAGHDGNGDGGPDRGLDRGHGLIGMRERAVMLGGRLEAGPTTDGGFLVSAFLPVDPDHREGEQ